MSTYRHWKTSELKVLRDHYPAGGYHACAVFIPHRSPMAMYKQAAKQGIRCLCGRK